jgi:Fe-S-cluster-containing hydrogenase component 2
MSKILLIYPEKCTGCRICELVCSFHHYKEFNPSKSRIRIIKDERRGLDIPITCMNCMDAPCMSVCPVDAIRRDSETGIVKIYSEDCIGCKLCIMVCPLGAISIDPSNGTAMKCDLCNGTPKCVKFCPTGALQYEDVSKLSIGHKVRKKPVEKVKELFATFYQTK